MPRTTAIREGRYHAPLRDKMESELLHAIRSDHADAPECRAELYRRGWDDTRIQWYFDHLDELNRESARRFREAREAREARAAHRNG